MSYQEDQNSSMDRASVPTPKYQTVEGSIPGQGRKKWKITTAATTTTKETTTTTSQIALETAEKRKKNELLKNGIDGTTCNF